jgi:CheY-like chemotaxis protein
MLISSENNAHSLVILVDDSAIDNFVNKKIINRYGFAENVIAFNKSREALAYLVNLSANENEELPSIVFLDLEMPEIDGYEFLDAFDLLGDRIKTNIQIVILTSSINPADVERCSKYEPVLTFLHKPLVKHNLDELQLILLKKFGTLVKY